MKKILLVDDDAIVRRGIRCSISWHEHGFGEILEASDGRQGLELLERETPDVILTDIKMPVCDGLWLCEQASARHKKLPIIIMSGYEDFEYARRAIHLGVKEYIVKPVDADALLDTLNRVVLESPACRTISTTLLPSGREISSIVQRAIRYVEANYMRPINVKVIASELYLSESYFSRQFKQTTDMNFIEFLNRYRIESAKALMGHADLKVTDIADMTGYQSYKYFHHNFVRYTGYQPLKYREIILSGGRQKL